MHFSKIFTFILFLFISTFSFGQHETSHDQTAKGTEAKEEKFNIGEMITHHISDAHDWHFATVGHTHVSIPLPVILYSPTKGFDVFSSSKFKNEHHNLVSYNGYVLDEHEKIHSIDGTKVYDFSITKNVASLILSAIILLLVFLTVAKGYTKNKGKAPTGIQSLFEPIITYVRDDIARPSIGEKDYQRFLPYLLTLFFFIWFNNMMGLLPGSANVTGNIAVTMVLAVITFFVTNLNGKKGYWKHLIAPPGVPGFVLPLIVPVEIIGVFVKPLTLMIRLFANITAGHIILLSLIGLIFTFKNYFIGGTVTVFVVAMNLLEILVALLQAFIFTLLSAMYIGSAVEDAHHDNEYDHGM